MVLTDREIQVAMENGQIVVEPFPDQIAYSSTSLDLTFSRFLREWKAATIKGVEQIVCPATDGYKFSEFSAEFSQNREMTASGFVLDPRSFVLGWTGENIELPIYSRLAAR